MDGTGYGRPGRIGQGQLEWWLVVWQQSVCPSVRLSVCPSVHPSVWRPFTGTAGSPALNREGAGGRGGLEAFGLGRDDVCPRTNSGCSILGREVWG